MPELFKDKTVALVGPANYLTLFKKDNENLSKIEECDVVVKLNNGINLSKMYSNLVSNRIDVLYNSLLDNCANGGILNVEDVIKFKIKQIITTPKSDMKGIAINQKSTNITNDQTFKKLHLLHNQHNIPTSIVDINLYNFVSSAVKCKPTTGVVALYDILSQKPKSLYVTGFNFFLSPPLKGYWGAKKENNQKIPYQFSTGGKTGPLRTEEEHAEVISNSKRHVHKDMWFYAKNTLLNKERVSFDPILKKILLLENFSKSDYNNIVLEFKNEKLKKSN